MTAGGLLRFRKPPDPGSGGFAVFLVLRHKSARLIHEIRFFDVMGTAVMNLNDTPRFLFRFLITANKPLVACRRRRRLHHKRLALRRA
jgi:hypothetical protein